MVATEAKERAWPGLLKEQRSSARRLAVVRFAAVSLAFGFALAMAKFAPDPNIRNEFQIGILEFAIWWLLALGLGVVTFRFPRLSMVGGLGMGVVDVPMVAWIMLVAAPSF